MAGEERKQGRGGWTDADRDPSLTTAGKLKDRSKRQAQREREKKQALHAAQNSETENEVNRHLPKADANAMARFNPLRLFSLINQSIKEDTSNAVNNAINNPTSRFGRTFIAIEKNLNLVSINTREIKSDTKAIRKSVDDLTKIVKSRGSGNGFFNDGNSLFSPMKAGAAAASGVGLARILGGVGLGAAGIAGVITMINYAKNNPDVIARQKRLDEERANRTKLGTPTISDRVLNYGERSREDARRSRLAQEYSKRNPLSPEQQQVKLALSAQEMHEKYPMDRTIEIRKQERQNKQFAEDQRVWNLMKADETARLSFDVGRTDPRLDIPVFSNNDKSLNLGEPKNREETMDAWLAGPPQAPKAPPAYTTRIKQLREKISVLQEGIAYHLAQSPTFQKRYDKRYRVALAQLRDAQIELTELLKRQSANNPFALNENGLRVQQMHPFALNDYGFSLLQRKGKYTPQARTVDPLRFRTGTLKQNFASGADVEMETGGGSLGAGYQPGVRQSSATPTEMATPKGRIFSGVDNAFGSYLTDQRDQMTSLGGSRFAGFTPGGDFSTPGNYETRSEGVGTGTGGNTETQAKAIEADARRREQLGRLFDQSPMYSGYHADQSNANRFTGKLADGGFKSSSVKVVDPRMTGGSMQKDAKGRVISTAETNMPAHQRAFLDTLAMGDATSGGSYWESPNYNTIVGGKTFTDMSDHPRVTGYVGPKGGSSAAGRYQFIKGTWDTVVKQYNKENPNDPIKDFSAKSQDKAAWWLAKSDYSRRTGGRDLDADLKSGNTSYIKSGLGGSGKDTTWEIFQRKSNDQIAAAFASNLKRNEGYATDGSSNKLNLDASKSLGTLLNPEGAIEKKPFQPANPFDQGTAKEIITPSSRVHEGQDDAKFRKQALDPKLKDVLDYAAQQAGVDKVEIVSGGQMSLQDAIAAGAVKRGKDWYLNGKPVRTGSTRHDHGGAGDLQLIKDGKVLDFNTKEGAEAFAAFAKASAQAGATGIGAGEGYMGSQTIHVGFGKEATWHPDSPAPQWLASSFAEGRKLAKNFDLDQWKAANMATMNGKLTPASRVATNASILHDEISKEAEDATAKPKLVKTIRMPQASEIAKRNSESAERTQRSREAAEEIRRERNEKEAAVRQQRQASGDMPSLSSMNKHAPVSPSLQANNLQSKNWNPAAASKPSTSGVKNVPTFWDRS